MTPGIEERLRTGMSRLTDFVEKVLRVKAPTTGIHQLVTQATRLEGVDIPVGSFLVPQGSD